MARFTKCACANAPLPYSRMPGQTIAPTLILGCNAKAAKTELGGRRVISPRSLICLLAEGLPWPPPASAKLYRRPPPPPPILLAIWQFAGAI